MVYLLPRLNSVSALPCKTDKHKNGIFSLNFIRSFAYLLLNEEHDYKIWEIMQQRVYETQIHNVDELKQRLVDVWSGLQKSVVDAAVSECRKRLHTCVRTKGGHFEHLM